MQVARKGVHVPKGRRAGGQVQLGLLGHSGAIPQYAVKFQGTTGEKRSERGTRSWHQEQ